MFKEKIALIKEKIKGGVNGGGNGKFEGNVNGGGNGKFEGNANGGVNRKFEGNVNGEVKGKFKENASEAGNKNDRKKMENLIVFAIILIITIVAINYIWSRR